MGPLVLFQLYNCIIQRNTETIETTDTHQALVQHAFEHPVVLFTLLVLLFVNITLGQR